MARSWVTLSCPLWRASSLGFLFVELMSPKGPNSISVLQAVSYSSLAFLFVELQLREGTPCFHILYIAAVSVVLWSFVVSVGLWR